MEAKKFLLLAITAIGLYCVNCDNVAQGKKAYQSSNYQGGGGAPGLAVDGNENTGWAGSSCTHTNQQANPWWVVDLGVSTAVKVVSITNRADTLGYRLHNFAIGLSDDASTATTNPSPANYRICALYNGPVGDGATIDFTCTGSSSGRYLIIQILGTDASFLTLCEVGVATVYV